MSSNGKQPTAKTAAASAPSELALQAELSRRSLRHFIEFAWPHVEPATPYVPGWHIDAICDHLEACTNGDVRRLIINIPPKHMKSRATGVFWPAWVWLRAPWHRWMCASYGAELAIDISRDCRRLVKSDWYRAVVAHLGASWNVDEEWQVDPSEDAASFIATTKRGYRLATSVGATGTGRGGNTIIIDDPHKADEVLSDTKRQAVCDWHDTTIPSRFNDPKTGVEVVVMQRLHEQDLTGHLLDLGGWEHLCLPAEYEPMHPFVWPDDPRRELGDPLWPEQFGPAELATLKHGMASAYSIAGQLQQRPAPREGGLFKRANWRYYPPEQPLELTRIVQSWDTALKEKTTADFTVGQVWGVFGANRFLLRSVRGQWGLAETLLQLRQLYRWVEDRWGNLAHTILVESAASGPDVLAELRNEVPGLLPITVKGDKIQRAEAVTPSFESHNVLVPGYPNEDGTSYDTRTPLWVQELIDECAGFPTGSHDDQVDALTQALNWLRGKGHLPSLQSEEPEFSAPAVMAGMVDKVF